MLAFPVRFLIRAARRRRPEGPARAKKVIILGLDGLDPVLCERMMKRDELPNLRRLRDEGSYRHLATSTPALSPVAWSTFATGTDSSSHAIYDFLSRDRVSYLPRLSSSEVYGNQKFFRLGPLSIPLRGGSIRMLRKSKTFWRVLSEYGIFSSVLRVPITFPVEPINGVMVAGMCVPDLRGTMGSFTYFTTSSEADRIGGMVVPIQKSDDWMEAEISGPTSPLDGTTLTLPIAILSHTHRKRLEVRLQGEVYKVPEHSYTPWIRLSFRAAPGVTLCGIVRFYTTSVDGPVGLYMTPIHIDPEKPAMPITHPPYFSTYLAKLIGPHATLGLAEDTWAMNERVLDEKAWLEQAYAIHEERKAMWFHSLEQLREGMVVCVFDITDRLQHMFFRYLDDDHPANRDKDTTEFKDTIEEMYRRMDELVGETMAYVDKDTALFVMSDHGFKTFRRGVNLNTWLVENGYTTLLENAGAGEFLSSVDWGRTKAYAIGLGNVYINVKGRESQGIVEPDDVDALKKEITEGLAGLQDVDGAVALRRMIDVQGTFKGPYRGDGPELIPGFAEGYRVSWDCARGVVGPEIFEDNTKSWSGDHCMDPEIVPGVLFSNIPVADDNPRLMDLGPTVLDIFGITVPRYML
ncbi:MAG: alkaline phosphatase family protein, partial [Candidatus Krumholzibacteriota bacterium]|nr:alkaline phosphatase family protein [Candidatus Krumholzibacteriota bacterium]